jgi:RHS repeat-associated protein
LSSILVNVKDRASNPLAQPLGVTASESGYGHDGNGNLTLADPVLQAQYNIMNLPTSIRTSAGKRHFAYVYGGGKYEARIEADTALSETRHYLGGIEFVDGKPENYNFGDGRIVYSDSVPPRPQFRLHDHLGNTVVFFEDKNLDGCITTEADTSGLAAEVLQRLWYYPFGMNMENLSTWETEPGQGYRYNGKERDTLSGWYEYGFRWYDAGIGRFTGVDPIADQFPWVSVFNYAENEPVGHIDLWGLQKVKRQESDGTFTLETVTVTAKQQGSNYDQSVDRYGFKGTFEEWQKTYGFEGMNYENASNYWNQAHSADFDANVVERDKAEAARIAVEKMTFWMGTVFPTVGGFAMSGLSPSLPSARGFNFTSPVSSNSSNGWLTLSSLDDVQGMPGLYQFSHANRGGLPYVGQSGDLSVRLATHFRQGNIGGNVLYRPMLGSSKLGREIGEMGRMFHIGGRTNTLSNLANMRFPISAARSTRLGLNLYNP